MYDVIVIGAGPAGCTASKVLAEKGYKILLVEKFKIVHYCEKKTLSEYVKGMT